MKDGRAVDALYLEFNKAFNTTCNNLIDKLSKYRLATWMVRWIILGCSCRYLSNEGATTGTSVSWQSFSTSSGRNKPYSPRGTFIFSLFIHWHYYIYLRVRHHWTPKWCTRWCTNSHRAVLAYFSRKRRERKLSGHLWLPVLEWDEWNPFHW